MFIVEDVYNFLYFYGNNCFVPIFDLIDEFL